MTLEKCLSKKKIIEIIAALDFVYEGTKYNVKLDDCYNNLTVVKLLKYKEGQFTRKGCICKCKCGNYVGPIRLQSLVNGDNFSCGCYQRELHRKQLAKRNYKHGCSTRANREHLYTLWGAMGDRALNPNRRDSKWYANKNLEVCEDWKDYPKFKEWALKNGYQEGLSIDRINNSIGYTPSNCRWVPVKEQNRNKTSNRLITANGKTQILADWCRELGLGSKLVSSRLSRGWSGLEALELI